MKRLLTYTRLQFKRMIRHMPFVVAVTVVLGICLAVALFSISKMNSEEDDPGKVTIGWVGDFENTFVEFGIEVIKSMDTSRFFLEIQELDEEEAREKLFKGEISAYIMIHQEFVDDAMVGKIGKLKFITREANADIVNLFKDEVLKLISCILVESQNGVFGLQTLLLENGFKHKEIYEMTEETALEYVGLIINRSNALETETIGFSDNLSFSGYMFSAVTMLLILLAGIACAPLFVRRDYSLVKLMSANRYGPCIQTAGEFVPFFATLGLVVACLSFGMMLGAGRLFSIVPELFASSISDMIVITIKFMPAIFLIISLQYLLYQMSGSIISGILIQFISSVLLGYLSGCFYPTSFFPKIIRMASGFLPSGIAREYFSSLLTDTASLFDVFVIVSYALILFALSTLIRRHRIKAV